MQPLEDTQETQEAAIDYIPSFKGELEQPYQIVGWQVAPKASAERIAQLMSSAQLMPKASC
jgi:hypothetical protein